MKSWWRGDGRSASGQDAKKIVPRAEVAESLSPPIYSIRGVKICIVNHQMQNINDINDVAFIDSSYE